MGSGMNNESRPVAFDLHGFVSVRLVDARPPDARAVARHLGPIHSDLSGEADITIRFVDRLVPDEPVRLLGRHDGGFTDDAFLLLRSKHKARTRARIPMEQIGGRCEIVCEHGSPAVPLLIAIVNLTALVKGVLPLHAAAFDWKGSGVVVTGWSKGGKTETLLSFMNRGARYIADEWCYIAPDGRRIFGLPEPVRLWRWQMAQLPQYRDRVGLARRLNLAAMGIVPAVQGVLPAPLHRSRPGRAAQRAAHFVEQRLNVQVPPERLFDQDVATAESEFTHLVFVMSAEDPATTAVTASGLDVADRMVHSLQYERQGLLGYYRMFRFAFPQLTNPHLENAESLQRNLLRNAFKDKPTLRVEHPYPVELSKLFDCIEPLIR